MNIADIKNAGKVVIDLLEKYHNPPQKELMLDIILLAYLTGKLQIKVSRQHHIYLYGSKKPSRIDFLLGGANPTVMELSPRPATGGAKLIAGQNISELRKLCRVKQSEAKTRVLLLLDLCSDSLDKKSLKNTYDEQNAGRGRFKRHSVRVIYVHREKSFDFLWRPFRQS